MEPAKKADLYLITRGCIVKMPDSYERQLRRQHRLAIAALIAAAVVFVAAVVW